MQKVGIIGSGVVGQQLGLGFLKLGYQVKIGTRQQGKLDEWLSMAGEGATVGSFSDAAQFGEMIVLCTKWTGVENAVSLAGKTNFSGKVVIDVTNPLIFEKEGDLPRLDVVYPSSAGAKVQRLLPGAQVVKAFNIVPAHFMTNPKLEEGGPDLFICGDNKQAKQVVFEVAKGFGWQYVHDLGDISQAYLIEALAMIIIRQSFSSNSWTQAFKLLKK